MSEKKITPKIEEIAADLLVEDKLKTFLEFYEFLNNNKISKVKTGINSWAIKYKDKRIGAFRFHGNLWLVSYFKSFTTEQWFEKCEKYLSVELKDFVLNNINPAPSGQCKKCKGVENQIILKKAFNNVCGCEPIKLINPDGKMLEYAKELLLIGKNIVDDIAAS